MRYNINYTIKTTIAPSLANALLRTRTRKHVYAEIKPSKSHTYTFIHMHDRKENTYTHTSTYAINGSTRNVFFCYAPKNWAIFNIALPISKSWCTNFSSSYSGRTENFYCILLRVQDVFYYSTEPDAKTSPLHFQDIGVPEPQNLAPLETIPKKKEKREQHRRNLKRSYPNSSLSRA